jgi:hypothetical protein
LADIVNAAFSIQQTRQISQFGRQLTAPAPIQFGDPVTKGNVTTYKILGDTTQRSGQGVRTLTGDLKNLGSSLNASARSAAVNIGTYTKLGAAAGTAAVGIGAAAVGIAAFSIANADVANRLQLSETSLKAVTTNLVDYYQAVALAKENQFLFGGTLADNIDSIRVLQLVANRTKADLADLTTTANLLATLNPAEGFQGAAFSLSELLSGDYASLVERFNLPRREVQAITEALTNGTITYAQALEDVQTLLARQGITLDTLNARTQTGAAAAERLAAAWERVQIATGKWAAGPLTAATNSLTFIVDRLADLLEGRGAVDITALAVGESTSLDDYNRRTQAARIAADIANQTAQAALGGGIQLPDQGPAALTQAQFDLIKALEATGLSAEAATSQVIVLTDAEAKAALASEAATQAVANRAQAQLNAVTATENAARVERENARALEEGSNAAIEAARAQDVFTAARRRQLDAARLQLRNVEEGRPRIPFTNTIENFVDTSVGGSSILGAYDPRAINVIDDTISAFAELEAARLRDAEAARVQEQAQQAFIRVIRSVGQRTGGDLQDWLSQVSLLYDVQIEQIKELLQLLGLYRQTSFGFLPVFQGSIAPGGFSVPAGVQTSGPPLYQNPYSNRFFPKTGGGGGSKSTEETDLERLRQRILEAERRYRKELLKIEADYYKRSNAARVVFSDQQFSSRAGFYDRLGQIEDQGLRRTLSAQFEQAQIDAGKISDQFGGDVAERFLQASEDAILARGQRQLGIQQAEAEGRFGDAEYLRGVDRLYRIDEDRRIERSKGTEDSIEQNRSDALKEAADSYRDTLEGFLIGEEKKLAAVKLVNDALREQGLLGAGTVSGGDGAITLNVQSSQLEDIKKSVDALALRLPVGV